MKISGNIVDVFNKEISSGYLTIKDGKIAEFVKNTTHTSNRYILPGFIDAHIHIESSMLLPCEFARLAAHHGTVAVVADPHEIANVMGLSGIEFMYNNSLDAAIKIYFGAPPCVPATDFETTGGKIDENDIKYLFEKYDLKFLCEVMNVPSVVNSDVSMMKKLNLARSLNKKIDGHAPGLKGELLKKYIKSGVSTDHECETLSEAKEKIANGMKILIREGSAAKNFETLCPLIENYPDSCMFCSDDLHPDDLIKGDINLLVKRGLEKGIDIFKVLQVACVNPVLHYGLDVGLIRIGDFADFIVVDNLENLNILETYVNGKMVYKSGKKFIEEKTFQKINNFQTEKIKEDEIKCKLDKGAIINIIGVKDKSLITSKLLEKPSLENGYVVSDINRDILKIVVYNRYFKEKPAVGFVKNFGLKEGAIASSVAHDSHNIVAVGADDKSICKAINLIVENKGGIAAAKENESFVLPLHFGGLMSGDSAYVVAEKYSKLNSMAREMGCKLSAPFMTLSFMALSVIPELKITDRGLFDYKSFKFIDIANKL
jgi:adenine deaminase